MSRTVVVGGGLSGLVAAHALQKRGVEVVVLEAGLRAGGVMHASRRDGFLLETGPNSFIDRGDHFRALVDELGLAGEIVTADPAAKARYVVHRGRLEPIPTRPPELLKTPLLSRNGKLRLLAEPLLARRTQSYDESLEEFGLRHFGAEATSRLLDAMQTGIYAGKLDELSAPSTFPQLVALEEKGRSLLLGMMKARKEGASAPRGVVSSFREGMGQLSEALAARLKGSIRTGAKVGRVARDGGGFRISFEGGELAADRVVLATHPRVSAEVVRALDAPLAEALRAIPHAPMVVVHVGIPRDRVDHALDGFGFLIPAPENRRILGCIFSSTLFPNRAPPGMALLTVLLGGRRRPELADLEERALVALVRDELRSLALTDAEPELVNVVRHPLGIPQYVVGHRARMETIGARLAQLPGLELVGWGYRGVSVADVVRESLAVSGDLTTERASA